MKRFLAVFLVLILSTPAYSATIIAQSLDTFSTINPKSQISLKVYKAKRINKSYYFEKNSSIKSNVVKVTDPKRGKRNAYFVLKPIYYTVPSIGKTVYFKNPKVSIKVIGYKKLDKKETAIKAGATAGGFVMTGFTQIFWFTRGFIHPQRSKGRIASGVNSAYKNSPLVYVEKGQELYVHNGDFLKLKFKH